MLNTTDNEKENISKLSKNKLIAILEEFQESSGYSSVTEYKKAISSGKVIFYSRSRLNMWERFETILKEKYR